MSPPNNHASSPFQLGATEARPVDVESWLNSLPYIDVHKTCSLMHAALQTLNREKIKPAVRVDLADLFADAYLYLINAHLRKKLRTSLQALPGEMQTAGELRRVAVEIAFSYKLFCASSSADKSAARLKGKPLLHATHQALRFLGHVQLLSFIEYAPAPANIWKEIHRLYVFAEQAGIHTAGIKDSEYPDSKNGSIEHTYKKIMLASLVDPYHLQFRAIWDIYDLLHDWSTRATLSPMRQASDPTSLFVIDLTSENRPVPYIKFEMSAGEENLRIIETSELSRQVTMLSGMAKQGGVTIPGFINEDPGSLLMHMERAWSLPPKRYFPRTEKSSTVEIAGGLSAIHYFLSGQRLLHGSGLNDGIVMTHSDAPSEQEHIVKHDIYRLDEWNIVNCSSGGFAALRKSPPSSPLRVGDLVGLPPNPESGDEWTICIIRWLMIIKQNDYRIGLQILAKGAEPVSLSGSSVPTTAALETAEEPGGLISLLASAGTFNPDLELTMKKAGVTRRLECQTLIDRSVAFDAFSARMLDPD